MATLIVLWAACSSGGAADEEAVDTPSATSFVTTTTARARPPSTTTVPSTTAAPAETTTSAPLLPPLTPGDEVKAVITPTGVLLPVVGLGADGAYDVLTPCSATAVVRDGTPLYGATVVLDPGHGGEETGAVAANGLVERDLNMAVAELTRTELEKAGATVLLTRLGNYRITLATRGEIVTRLDPAAFVSIHHNGGSDGPSDQPGTETFYQIASPESRRLAGILWEELFALFEGYEGISWQADFDAGAKFRPSDDGGDYYGILRRTAGVAAVLSEALFISNPPEAELLARPDVQQAEAEAISRAVVRFLITDDPGSGYVDPYPRTEPAGPGGGSDGCEDPPL